MSTKIYTIMRGGRVMTHGSKNRISYRTANWLLWRLKKMVKRGYDLNGMDVYISDFETLRIEKMPAKTFFEIFKDPKETEKEIIEYFGFKTDLTSLREMYSRDMFSSHNSSLVKEFLLQKGII